MARKHLIRTADFPYHIYNRSNNKEFFYLEQEELWVIFMECFYQLRIQFMCDIHYFVLMKNHYHLIISTPRSNLGDAMKYLHREVARRANQSAKRINHFFGARYKWSVINQEIYFWNCVKYVLRNPVRAKICDTVFNYEYSSLNRSAPKFMWEQIDFFQSKKSPIDLDKEWLNEPFLKEIEEGIQKALNRREFVMPRSKSGRAFRLDELQYKKGTVT